MEDRSEAGRRLADQLERRRLVNPIVLGIPRGGVVVAYEIAQRLAAPLDVLVVRKVGAPGDPEYGLGAVAEGGLVVVDERRAREAGYSREALEPEVQRELEEVRERARRFRRDRPLPILTGRCAVVVDDGVATGGTVEAAIAVVRAQGPASVVVALGVAPPDAIGRLRRAADDLVIALAPPRLEAVGQWYHRFEPVEDAQVESLLARAVSASRPKPSPPHPGEA